jgi:hypothetical protein
MLGFIAAGAFYDAAQDAGPWACGDILLLPLYQKHFAGTWAERTAITSVWFDSLNLILTKKGGKTEKCAASDQMFVVKEMSLSKVRFAY